MQRKNCILKGRSCHRSGIAMIMAIFVVIIIATIMAFSIQMTTKTAKRAVDIYVENQANLFAKNAAEYAVYKISKEKSCVDFSALFTPPIVLRDYYTVDVSVRYFVSDPNAACPVSDVALTPVGDADAYAYARIDVTVTVDDDDVATEPVRIFRRYVEDITPFVY